MGIRINHGAARVSTPAASTSVPLRFANGRINFRGFTQANLTDPCDARYEQPPQQSLPSPLCGAAWLAG